jgi:monoamine oxidase
MTRNEFLKICGLFGIGMPLSNLFQSCEKDNGTSKPFSGKVLIIGAGTGGLSAGYFLKQQGTDFEILEASSVYGGRMRINTDFSDFPIPLGAEWLETNTYIFREIVNDASVQVNVPTVEDSPDRKFVNYSWFNFFEDYIVPSISDKISFNTIVQSIDYSNPQIVVNTQNGQLTADKVVMSVPLKILKDGDISFTPGLPQSKLNAINNLVVWDGFKAFFEFNSNFYGDSEYVFQINPASNGQKIYYNTTKNILGLFVVGQPAQEFLSRSGNDLKNFILSELDSIYNNQATPGYIKHITQNWNSEPFIKGGYLTDYADWKTVRELGKTIANKLYFAASEFTDGEDWVSVHTAAQSAKRAIEAINS